MIFNILVLFVLYLIYVKVEGIKALERKLDALEVKLEGR
jgi:hypothetical protein